MNEWENEGVGCVLKWGAMIEVEEDKKISMKLKCIRDTFSGLQKEKL